MRWDDLQYFLELSRSGTLTSAARRLGVQHTTVARRIRALEADVGKPLFDRTEDGFALTEAGEKLIPAASEMERSYGNAELAVAGSAAAMAGIVRIGCTEGYGTTLLPRHLARFRQLNPEILIDLLVLPRVIQSTRHDADIVISIDRPARGQSTITKQSDYELRLYATEEYLRNSPSLEHAGDLDRHVLIDYVDYFSVAKNLPNLEGKIKLSQRGMHSTSLLAQREAVIAGAGIAILPNYLARECPDLKPVLASELQFTRTYWLILRDDVRLSPRVRAVSNFLKRMAKQERL
jgi:DNA-binding transcriptional LysR family regulator